jgi:4-hydroxybenzoate decarboxylase subunit C
MYLRLGDFVSDLKKSGQLVEVEAPVDTALELAEVHRRVAAANGPALLFRNPKGSSFPVATNLYGSRERIDMAFANRPRETIAELLQLLTREFPPALPTLWQKRKTLLSLKNIGMARRRGGAVMERSIDPVDLGQLPMLKSWPEDGGHFLTLPLVYTEPPEGGPGNLGIYRVQRFDEKTTGLHWQIGKGGGFHYAAAERLGQPLPVTIYLGGPPALLMSALAPLPENVPEVLLASFLQGRKLRLTKERLIAECEFALIGEARPHERRPEGPFGDHYGYYSLTHDFPVFHCKKIHHRKGAIYPATVVGKPRQEDYYLGNYLQELLSPLFPIVMPGVKDLWSYGETGFHSLSAAVIEERYGREAMAHAFRILGEGQLSLTKFLLLTDQPVDLQDFKGLLTTVLERFRPETDLYIFSNLSIDTLDYTGPELNKGSRGVLLGLGDPVRKLPHTYSGPLKARPFCPGCLVVEEPPAELPKEWPLIVVVDDLEKATASEANFLWTVFTRFEPAADIHAADVKTHRHHLCYEAPILIDARMKPSYPDALTCDEETAELVTSRWEEYFPDGMEMGDGDQAHVY